MSFFLFRGRDGECSAYEVVRYWRAVAYWPWRAVDDCEIEVGRESVRVFSSAVEKKRIEGIFFLFFRLWFGC